MTMVLERPAPDLARSFAFAPHVRDALAAFQTRSTVVRLGTIDNETLGVARWETLAEVWSEPGSELRSLWLDNPVVSVGPGDDPELVLATRTPVIVLGVDNELHGYARAVIDGIRASCSAVLVVDLGHRLTGHAYADIATFGFDRARGFALLELLTGAVGA
jgi:hypothetical protein